VYVNIYETSVRFC